MEDCGLSLYLHFPYCLYKCHYCDFNSYARSEFDELLYVSALLEELELKLNWAKKRHLKLNQDKPLYSIFMGGGTPSLFSPESIKHVITGIQRHFDLTEKTEITLECNPKTIDKDKLTGFKDAGVTRISLGVQSFHDQYLGRFGRIHSAQDAKLAIQDIKKVGFKSFNVDLIYGFPNQTSQEWESDLKDVIAFRPQHLSCYALTVESETPYEKRIHSGVVSPPNPDDQADYFNLTRSVLNLAGYVDYEISNYAIEGNECQHNLRYWNYGPFLGLGAGASGQLFLSEPKEDALLIRTLNDKKPDEYMINVKQNKIFFETEKIDSHTASLEYVMMGLRLKQGLDQDQFLKIFSRDIMTLWIEPFDDFVQKGYLKEGRWALTEAGTLHLDEILRSLI